MSLLFLTSPAKTLDLTDNWKKDNISTTIPRNIDQANIIALYLKKQSLSDLQKVLSVSDNIAQLNFDRMKQWDKKHDESNSKPALLMYDGAVYKQIDKNNFNKEQQAYSQNNVRILSGFYGLLKPYDLIQPYRLEMNNKVKMKEYKSLVEYWKKDITDLINQDIKGNNSSAVINLASKEYSQTIDQKKLSIPFISIDFKENRDGKLKTIAIYAKQARGAMINKAIKDNIQTIDDLTKLNVNGYTFLKKEDRHLVFTKQ
ncbi:MAG: peroxide stress protein YaaA [Candidatus Pacebacteria bacterium]|nr:peroxide stress protein YaaA [Candidatus Paceibacterota bacterium]